MKIREVAYRDLLGREIIKLEEEKIGAYLKDQNVLVTGGGGSIGSELCRQICRFQPEKIILFERAESPLHAIELELKQSFKNVIVIPVLADIQDKNQLNKAFEGHQPNIVFHAAAYKHVPMLEMHPWKAIDNNVLGTKNLMEEHRGQVFILEEHRGQVFILDKRVLYCSKEGGGDSPRLNKGRRGFNWANKKAQKSQKV